MTFARFIRTESGALRFDGKTGEFYAAAQPVGKPLAALVIDQNGDPSRLLPSGWGCNHGDREKVRPLYLRFFSETDRDFDQTYDPYGD